MIEYRDGSAPDGATTRPAQVPGFESQVMPTFNTEWAFEDFVDLRLSSTSDTRKYRLDSRAEMDVEYQEEEKEDQEPVVMRTGRWNKDEKRKVSELCLFCGLKLSNLL